MTSCTVFPSTCRSKYLIQFLSRREEPSGNDQCGLLLPIVNVNIELSEHWYVFVHIGLENFQFAKVFVDERGIIG